MDTSAYAWNVATTSTWRSTGQDPSAPQWTSTTSGVDRPSLAKRASMTLDEVGVFGSTAIEWTIQKSMSCDIQTGRTEPVRQSHRDHDRPRLEGEAKQQRTNWGRSAPRGPAEFGGERSVHDGAVGTERWILDDDLASSIHDREHRGCLDGAERAGYPFEGEVDIEGSGGSPHPSRRQHELVGRARRRQRA